MSSNIDSRIVQMQFENSQFESGVKETLKSLEELKKSLDFKDADKSIADLQKAGDSFSLAKMANGVDDITNRFSTMGIVGMRMIERLTDKVADFAEKAIKGLTIEQPMVGFDKYTDMTKSVQTIFGATHNLYEDDRQAMDDIEAQLGRLMAFTDETSYNFTDMVNNIGKFTSMNVPLTDAVTAMEGISVWAASAGQGTQQAAHAMYNLAQAMGSGYVKLVDWKSINLANMSTAAFKNQVIETAKAMGKLDKNGKIGGVQVSLENFESTLQKGWFDKDVLLQVLTDYGSFADAVSAMVEDGFTAQEAIKALEGSFPPFAVEAYKAAQEATTFKEAIIAVKDAASTKWMQIWKSIFGDYLEARETWTKLANDLYEIFVEPLSSISDAFKKWSKYEINGHKDLIQGLSDFMDAIKTVIEAVGGAFGMIFPNDDGERTISILMRLTEKIKNFGAALKQLIWIEEAVIGTHLEQAFVEIDPLSEITGTLKRGGKNDKAEVKKMQQYLMKAGYGDLLGPMLDDGIFGPRTEKALKQYQKDMGLEVTGVFDDATRRKMLGDKIQKFAGYKIVEDYENVYSPFLQSLMGVVKAFAVVLKGLFKILGVGFGIISRLFAVIMPIGLAIFSILGSLADAFSNFIDTLLEPEKLDTFFRVLSVRLGPIKKFAENAAKGLLTFFGITKEGEETDKNALTIGKLFENFKKGLKDSKAINALSKAFKSLWNSIKKLGNTIKSKWSSIKEAFAGKTKSFIEKISTALGSLTGIIGKLISYGVELIAKVIDKIPKIVSGIGSFFSAIFNPKDADGKSRPTIVSKAIDAVTNIFKSVKNFVDKIPQYAQQAWDAMVNLYNSITGSTLFQNIKGKAEEILGDIGEFFRLLLDGIIGFFSTSDKEEKELVQTGSARDMVNPDDSDVPWFEALKQRFSSFQALGDFITKKWNELMVYFGTDTIWNTIVEWFNNTWPGVKQTIIDAFNWLSSMAGMIADVVVQFLTDISSGGTFRTSLDKAIQNLQKSDLADYIRQKMLDLENAITTLFGRIIDAVFGKKEKSESIYGGAKDSEIAHGKEIEYVDELSRGQQALDKIQGAFDSINTFFDETVKKIETFVKAYSESDKTGFIDRIDKGIEALGGTGIKTTIQVTIERIRKFFTELIGQIRHWFTGETGLNNREQSRLIAENGIGAIGSETNEYALGLKTLDEISATFDKITGFFENAADKIGKFTKAYAESENKTLIGRIDSGLDALGSPTLTETFDRLRNFFIELLGRIVYFFNPTDDAPMREVYDGEGNVESGVDYYLIGVQALENINATFDKIIGFFGNVKEKIDAFIKAYTETENQDLITKINAGLTAINSPTLTDTFKKILNFFIELIGKIRHWFMGDDAVLSADERSQIIAEHELRPSKDPITNDYLLGLKTLDEISATFDKITGFFENAADKIGKFTKAYAESENKTLIGRIDSGLDALGSPTLTETFDRLRNFFIELLGRIVYFFNPTDDAPMREVYDGEGNVESGVDYYLIGVQALENINATFDKIIGFFGNVKEKIDAFIKAYSESENKTLIGRIDDGLKAIKAQTLSDTFKKIREFFISLLGKISLWFKGEQIDPSASQEISDENPEQVAYLQEGISVLSTIESAFNKIMSFLSSTVEKIEAFVDGLIHSDDTSLEGRINTAIGKIRENETISSLLSRIRDFFAELIGHIVVWFTGKEKAQSHSLGAGPQDSEAAHGAQEADAAEESANIYLEKGLVVIKKLESIINSILGFFKMVADAIGDFIAGFSGEEGSFKQKIDAGLEKLKSSELAGWIKETAAKIAEFVKQIFNEVLSSLGLSNILNLDVIGKSVSEEVSSTEEAIEGATEEGILDAVGDRGLLGMLFDGLMGLGGDLGAMLFGTAHAEELDGAAANASLLDGITGIFGGLVDGIGLLPTAAGVAGITALPGVLNSLSFIFGDRTGSGSTGTLIGSLSEFIRSLSMLALVLIGLSAIQPEVLQNGISNLWSLLTIVGAILLAGSGGNVLEEYLSGLGDTTKFSWLKKIDFSDGIETIVNVIKTLSDSISGLVWAVIELAAADALGLDVTKATGLLESILGVFFNPETGLFFTIGSAISGTTITTAAGTKFELGGLKLAVSGMTDLAWGIAIISGVAALLAGVSDNVTEEGAPSNLEKIQSTIPLIREIMGLFVEFLTSIAGLDIGLTAVTNAPNILNSLGQLGSSIIPGMKDVTATNYTNVASYVESSGISGVFIAMSVAVAIMAYIADKLGEVDDKEWTKGYGRLSDVVHLLTDMVVIIESVGGILKILSELPDLIQVFQLKGLSTEGKIGKGIMNNISAGLIVPIMLFGIGALEGLLAVIDEWSDEGLSDLLSRGASVIGIVLGPLEAFKDNWPALIACLAPLLIAMLNPQLISALAKVDGGELANASLKFGVMIDIVAAVLAGGMVIIGGLSEGLDSLYALVQQAHADVMGEEFDPNTADTITDLIYTGGETLMALGEAIGNLVGGIVHGFLAAFTGQEETDAEKLQDVGDIMEDLGNSLEGIADSGLDEDLQYAIGMLESVSNFAWSINGIDGITNDWLSLIGFFGSLEANIAEVKRILAVVEEETDGKVLASDIVKIFVAIGNLAELMSKLINPSEEWLGKGENGDDFSQTPLAIAMTNILSSIDDFMIEFNDRASVVASISNFTVAMQNIANFINDLADGGKMFERINGFNNGDGNYDIIHDMMMNIAGLITVIDEDVISELDNPEQTLNSLAAIAMIMSSIGSLPFEALGGIGSSDDPNNSNAFVSKFEDVGKNFVLGLAHGINDNDARGLVIKSVRDLCVRLIEEAYSTLDMASPSKEAMTIGEFFTKGLGIGVTNEEDSAIDASGSVANSMLDAVRTSLLLLSGLLSEDIDAAPVITPVVDLTNAQQAAALIPGLFGNNPTFGVQSTIAANSAVTSTDNRPVSNQNGSNTGIIAAINQMNGRIESLGSAILSMQVVMDSGALVGQIAGSMDKELGSMAARRSRI